MLFFHAFIRKLGIHPFSSLHQLRSSHRTVRQVRGISEGERPPAQSLKQASTVKAAKGSSLFLLILASTFLKSLFALLRSAYFGFEHLLERFFFPMSA